MTEDGGRRTGSGARGAFDSSYVLHLLSIVRPLRDHSLRFQLDAGEAAAEAASRVDVDDARLNCEFGGECVRGRPWGSPRVATIPGAGIVLCDDPRRSLWERAGVLKAGLERCYGERIPVSQSLPCP